MHIRALVEINQRWLGQAVELLERLDDAAYTTSPRGLDPHRAGGHLRHVIEFYESFLNGLEFGLIDYDARRRDLSIERSRAAAIARIQEVSARLERINVDAVVDVRMEDSGAADLLTSSVGRELQVLSSHTIHHFALMSITLRALSVPVEREFGMAPSTLAHLRKQAA